MNARAHMACGDDRAGTELQRYTNKSSTEQSQRLSELAKTNIE